MIDAEGEPLPNRREVLSVGRAELWSGPIPSPATLAEFDQIMPGLAREIVDEFKAEASHRRACETRESRLDVASTLFGQALAGLFAIGSFGVTCYAIADIANWVAGIFGAGTIASGIAAFLGRKKAGWTAPNTARSPSS